MCARVCVSVRAHTTYIHAWCLWSPEVISSLWAGITGWIEPESSTRAPRLWTIRPSLQPSVCHNFKTLFLTTHQSRLETHCQASVHLSCSLWMRVRFSAQSPCQMGSLLRVSFSNGCFLATQTHGTCLNFLPVWVWLVIYIVYHIYSRICIY